MLSGGGRVCVSEHTKKTTSPINCRALMTYDPALSIKLVSFSCLVRLTSSIPHSNMTKLAEWLFGISVVGALWGVVTFDLLGLRLPAAWQEVAWPMPVYLLVAFGCYSLATVGYRVATFNDCEEAARELQEQIQEARVDLRRKGLRF